MKKLKIGVENSNVSILSDGHYSQKLFETIENCKKRIYVELFIVEVMKADSKNLVVVKLIKSISDALKRGVRVRIVIGGSSSNFEIQDITETAFEYLNMLGIPTVLLSMSDAPSSHSKVVVVDDFIYIGSHNWSPGAFSGQRQDSIIIKDEAISAYFAHKIGQKWLTVKKSKNV